MAYSYFLMAKDALKMFLYLGFELTALFIIVCFIVAFVKQYFPDEKIQKILSGKKGGGYIAAALLGMITPFCSCSGIPVLQGLLKANAGFGQVMTFLFISPLLNPVIIILFLAVFGKKTTVIYFLTALVVSVSAAFILKISGFEKFITEKDNNSCCVSSCNCNDTVLGFKNRALFALKSAAKQYRDIFPYLLLGISIGAFIHGFIPSEIIVKYAGGNNIFAVPIAAVIGIPLYVRVEAIIPLAGMLSLKGMSLGAIMALIIGSSGASITEVILLKSMFKWPLIIAFLTVIFIMAVFAGYLFQYVIYV